MYRNQSDWKDTRTTKDFMLELDAITQARAQRLLSGLMTTQGHIPMMVWQDRNWLPEDGWVLRLTKLEELAKLCGWTSCPKCSGTGVTRFCECPDCHRLGWLEPAYDAEAEAAEMKEWNLEGAAIRGEL